MDDRYPQDVTMYLIAAEGESLQAWESAFHIEASPASISRMDELNGTLGTRNWQCFVLEEGWLQ